MSKKPFFALNLSLAPLVYLAGQGLLSRWLGQGPDLIWLLSHGLLLAGALLFLPAITGLTYQLGKHAPILAGLAGAACAYGALALAGQFSIDLVVGYLTSSQAEMSAFLRGIQAVPGVSLVFYHSAPVFFFTGWLVLGLLLSFTHITPAWTGLAAGLGFIAIGWAAGANDVNIFLLGFAALELGVLRLGWKILMSRDDNSGEGTFSGLRRNLT